MHAGKNPPVFVLFPRPFLALFIFRPAALVDWATKLGIAHDCFVGAFAGIEGDEEMEPPCVR